jgi:hypothetical protein
MIDPGCGIGMGLTVRWALDADAASRHAAVVCAFIWHCSLPLAHALRLGDTRGSGVAMGKRDNCGRNGCSQDGNAGDEGQGDHDYFITVW